MTLLLHYMAGERPWKISLAVRKKRRFSESGQPVECLVSKIRQRESKTVFYRAALDEVYLRVCRLLLLFIFKNLMFILSGTGTVKSV